MEDKNLKVSFITRDTRDTDETAFKNKKQMMEILDDNAILEENTEVNFKTICQYAPGFYFNSIPLMFNRMNPYLLNMISLIFIAFYGNATYTAAFGLGNAIFMFFWQTFTQVNGETQGINCSKAYGAGDYKLMRLHFYRGFALNILVTLLSAALYTNIHYVLIPAGFQLEMVMLAKSMVTFMIPALFIQTINEMLRNYLMSQKVTKPFIWINLAAFAFFPIGGYFIIYKTGWGVAGFGLFKFIVETISMVGLIILQKKYGHPESLHRESMKAIFSKAECMQYLRDFGKILAGWYASYFGLEINTVLCGLTKDTVTMACWVSFMNVFAIIWTIGAGLAITTRTNCGINVGANKPLTAKKYAKMGFVLGFIYSIVGALIIIFCRRGLAAMFTEVPAVLDELSFTLMLLGFLCILLGTGATISTIFRTIDRSGLYSIIMLINQVAVNTTLAIIFLFYMDLKAAGVAYAFLTSWGVTFFITVWYPFRKFDWKTLYKKRESLTA